MNTNYHYTNLFQTPLFTSFGAPSSMNVDELFNQQFKSSGIPSSTTSCLQDTIDEHIVQEFKKNIISGFLNLSEQQGWPEGHDNKVGAAFTRLMLRKYYNDGKGQLGKYKPVFERAINAFGETGKMVEAYLQNGKGVSSPLLKEVADAHRPKANRVAYDCAVTGWQKHAVCRMVGNIASQYGSTKPFFEILVNSQRNSSDDPTCQPFYITIHNNEAALDERRKTLASMKAAPSIIAHSIFYSSSQTKPEVFMEKYADQIGPNSKRILEGLVFLQNTTIPAQTVGNCWMKQPMRCLLATLYLELLSVETQLTPEEAWSMAKEFYLCIQRATSIPYVENLLQNTEVTPLQLQSAKQAIEKRKTL